MRPSPRRFRGRGSRRSSPRTDSSCSSPWAAWARAHRRGGLCPSGHDRHEVSAAVTVENVGGELPHPATSPEGDDAAAEAATNQARPERTGRGREVHEAIQLGRRDLVVVPKRAMRRAQELTESRVVPGGEGGYGFADAGVLGHDVANPPVERWRQSIEDRVQRLRVELAKRCDSQVAASLLALLTPLVIAARRVLVSCARVDDRELDRSRKRNHSGGPVTHVDEEGIAGPTVHR